MSTILNILLLLAFGSTIAVTVMAQQPSGPEGPIGAWLVLAIPYLFLAILVVVMVAEDSLNFVSGGRPVQVVIAVGIFITFSIALFAILGRYNGVIQGLLIAVPYLILAGCAAVIHHSDSPNPRLVHLVAAMILGGAALAGWGLAGTGALLCMKEDLERSALRAQREREQEDQREQWEVAEYAKLDDSRSLYALLQFVWSRNDQVRRQAREQVSHFPGLDDKLIELLDQDCKEAVSYVANVHENPPAKFAPAWGRMLERQMERWDSLQYDEHAGTWEQNLIAYFKGAQKIQLAGGSLRTELLPWHQHLQKCRGLGNLADFVRDLLETEPNSG
jgi:hypothetical protein